MRNPIDFTPKSWYDEIDRQAKADREWRIHYRIFACIFYVAFLLGIVMLLKSL